MLRLIAARPRMRYSTRKIAQPVVVVVVVVVDVKGKNGSWLTADSPSLN